MSEENQTPDEAPSQEEKQAALKDKLKDMGVMQDENQPPADNDPTFFKSKWFVLSVIAVAVGFWYWYSNAELSEQGDHTADMNSSTEHTSLPGGYGMGPGSQTGSQMGPQTGSNMGSGFGAGPGAPGPGWAGPGYPPPYPPSHYGQANDQTASTDTGDSDESQVSQAEPYGPNRNIPPMNDWRGPPPGFYMPPPPPPRYYGRTYYPPPAYYGRPYYGNYPPPPYPY